MKEMTLLINKLNPDKQILLKIKNVEFLFYIRKLFFTLKFLFSQYSLSLQQSPFFTVESLLFRLRKFLQFSLCSKFGLIFLSAMSFLFFSVIISFDTIKHFLDIYDKRFRMTSRKHNWRKQFNKSLIFLGKAL